MIFFLKFSFISLLFYGPHHIYSRRDVASSSKFLFLSKFVGINISNGIKIPPFFEQIRGWSRVMMLNLSNVSISSSETCVKFFGGTIGDLVQHILGTFQHDLMLPTWCFDALKIVMLGAVCLDWTCWYSNTYAVSLLLLHCNEINWGPMCLSIAMCVNPEAERQSPIHRTVMWSLRHVMLSDFQRTSKDFNVKYLRNYILF